MIDSTQHASHYWRDLSADELREVLRAASWRTDKLDGKSLTRPVREREHPETAAFIDSVLDGRGRVDG
jgi:hypothetical protein